MLFSSVSYLLPLGIDKQDQLQGFRNESNVSLKHIETDNIKIT